MAVFPARCRVVFRSCFFIFSSSAPAAGAAQTSEIDWEAARNDLASARSLMSEDAPVMIQSAGEEAPPVPVLLPTGIVSIQSADGTGGPRFRPLADGYFAAYPGPKYDVIVNGTNQISDVDGKSRTRDETMTFTATVAGAQVSLSRYGADYLIEFECNEIDADTGSCISEEEAMSVAENLIVAGSR